MALPAFNNSQVQQLLRLGLLAEYVTGLTNLTMTEAVGTMLKPENMNKTAMALGPALKASSSDLEPIMGLSVLQYWLTTVEHNNTWVLHTAMAVFWSLFATVCVILRFYARAFIKKKLYFEEWVVLLALAFSHAEWMVGGVGRPGYINTHHTWDTTFEDFVLVNKMDFIQNLLYTTGLACIRGSLLVLYLRLSPHRTFRICVYIATAIVTAFYVASIFYFIFQCKPVDFWNHLVTMKCIDRWLGLIIGGAVIILADFIIFLLPIPLVWRLKMQMREKVLACGVFAIGIFVSLVSAVRLRASRGYVSDLDIYEGIRMAVWSNVELNLAIVISCVPAFRAIAVRHFPSLIRRASVDDSPAIGSSTVSSAIRRVRRFAAQREQRRLARNTDIITDTMQSQDNYIPTSPSAEEVKRGLEPLEEVESKESSSSDLEINRVRSSADVDVEKEAGRR